MLAGLAQQRLQNRPDIVEEPGLRPYGGVDAVSLDQCSVCRCTFEQEGDKGQVMLLSQVLEETLECLGIATTVVGRQDPPDQKNPGAGCLYG